MQHTLDILATGIHDAKNQLFRAETLAADLESRLGVDLGEVRYAIEAAAGSLVSTLDAYRLLGHTATPVVQPTVVIDLIDEVVLDQRRHLVAAGLELDVLPAPADAWPLLRGPVMALLNNALQNAGRFARRQIRLGARIDDEALVLTVEDDGPGFATLPPESGIGLVLAERVAALHERHGRSGSLQLCNGGSLGGAVFSLRLP